MYRHNHRTHELSDGAGGGADAENGSFKPQENCSHVFCNQRYRAFDPGMITVILKQKVPIISRYIVLFACDET